jgi:hypothetical protein
MEHPSSLVWWPITLGAIIVFGAILQWLDSLAIKVPPGNCFPAKWFLWAAKLTHDNQTGQYYWYRILMVRLPSYVWGYQINIDDMGWNQYFIAFIVGRRGTGSKWEPHNGFNLLQGPAINRDRETNG